MKIYQKLIPRPSVSLKAKLIGRMKLGQLFSLPEQEFSHYIEEIEKDPFFQKLLKEYNIVSYRKFKDIAQPYTLPLREELTVGKAFELEDFLQEDPQAWPLVKRVATRLGKETFSRFLWGEAISINEIAKKCRLSKEESHLFLDFINRFQLRKLFVDSSPVASPKTCRVACIEKRGEDLLILPLGDSSYLSRGEYAINYQKWERLLREEKLSSQGVDRMGQLLRRLDLINRRTTTLHQVLYHLKEIQRAFFLSARDEDLVPLTQKDVADQIGMNPSSISRTIANRSIITPQGKERLIKSFFGRGNLRALISKVLAEERENLSKSILSRPLSDEMIREKLEDIYGIKVARRTVNKYRRRLGVSSSAKRKPAQKKEMS